MMVIKKDHFIFMSILTTLFLFMAPLYAIATDITTNQFYPTDPNWADTVNVNGANITFNSDANAAADFHVYGTSSIVLGSVNTLTVAGDFNNNFNAGTIGLSGKIIVGDTFSVQGYGTQVTLDNGSTLTADHFEVEDLHGTARFIMEAGSTVNAGVSSDDGIWVGFDIDSRSVNPAYLIIEGDNNNTLSPANINVGIVLQLASLGQLVVEDNSTLNINIANGQGDPNGQGVFLIGAYAGDLPNMPHQQPSDQDWAGGTLSIGAGSTVAVNQRMYVGDGGVIDIAPGGKLAITGDGYFKSGSIYKVGINATDISLITVSNVAHFETGSVVSLPTNLYNSVGAIFFTANSYDNNILPISSTHAISRNGTDLIVGGIDSSNSIKTIAESGDHGVSGNYVAAGQYIDHVVGSTNAALAGNVAAYLDQALIMATQNDPLADVAFKQLIGEDSLMVMDIYTDIIHNIHSVLDNRFFTLHTARYGAPSSGSSDSLNSIWISGFGSWSRQSNVNGLFGYKYNVGGVVLGYDRQLASVPGLTLGLNAAWSSGRLRSNDGYSSAKTNTFSVGGYATYEFDNGLFFQGTLGFGFTDTDFDSRQVFGGRKESSFRSNSFQVGLDVGYNFAVSENFSIIPTIGINYVHINQSGWRDRIVYNPNNILVSNWYSSSKIDYLEVPVFVKFQGNFRTSGGIEFTPELKVGGIFVVNRPNHNMRVGFVGSNDSFAIRGYDSGRSRFVVEAGLKAKINDTFNIFTSYRLETHRSFTSHSAQIGLRFDF
jgi:outer membrane autotransporter protein